MPDPRLIIEEAIAATGGEYGCSGRILTALEAAGLRIVGPNGAPDITAFLNGLMNLPPNHEMGAKKWQSIVAAAPTYGDGK